MKTFIGAFLFSLAYSGASGAQNIPFNPVTLDSFVTESHSASLARLKINLATEEGAKVPDLRFGSITVCSKTACYRPAGAMLFNYRDASTSAALVADVLIPNVDLETIHFESIQGGNFYGAIKLDGPLKIGKGFYGGEILVMIKPSIDGGRSTYQPVFATSTLIRENGRSIFYNPKLPLTVVLDYGVTFKLPARALLKPQIFNAQIHDVGNDFPLVDIYPDVKFLKNGVVSAHAVQRRVNQKGAPGGAAVRVPPPLMPSGQLAMQRANPVDIGGGSIVPVEKTISKTGLIRDFDFQNVQPSAGKQSIQLSNGVITAAATQYTCSDYLSIPYNVSLIRAATVQSGTAYVDWCVNIPPYVHIMFTDTYDARVKFKVPRFTALRAEVGTPGYGLNRLGVLAPYGSGVAINGFYWAGDEGTGPYQWGVAEGYLMADGLVGGANRQGGGTTGGTGLSAGNKLIMVGFADMKTEPVWVETSLVNYVYPNARFQISSSTSILKFGQCSTDTEYNAWSAVGAGWGNMVFMSSASGTSTNAAELCPLFKYLGASGALRLDGGPSAAMVSNGTLLNPLTGFYSLKYGFSRYIAYGLQIGW